MHWGGGSVWDKIIGTLWRGSERNILLGQSAQITLLPENRVTARIFPSRLHLLADQVLFLLMDGYVRRYVHTIARASCCS